MQRYYNGSFCAVRSDRVKEKLGTATGKNIKVGVIDSGWDRRIIDDRIKPGINLVDPDDELCLGFSDNYNDTNGHGTSCTDLILRIAPDVSIYPIRVFGKHIETSTNILIEAIKWSVEKELKVLNFSLGTLLPEALEPLYKACEYARRKGIIIIAAKSNSEDWSYPAIFENAIGVEQKVFKDIWDYIFRKDEAVECIAKGTFDDVLILGGKRVRSGGNSFAAPIISGLAALLVDKYNCNDLDNVRNLLNKFDNKRLVSDLEMK